MNLQKGLHSPNGVGLSPAHLLAPSCTNPADLFTSLAMKQVSQAVINVVNFLQFFFVPFEPQAHEQDARLTLGGT